MDNVLTPEQEFLKAVGVNIRNKRKSKGYTLEALGEDIGLDKSNTYRIEKGKNITLLTLLKIALFLDVKPEELLKTDVEIRVDDAERFIAYKKASRKKSSNT
ncbi:MAG: helix-turn-helix domain-containing protein [Flavobacteriales bacterium]|jgi:transcriptional regulator with XRE-family HTH domain